MKVLLDESVPRALGFALQGHFVRTVQTMGWNGLANGKLLSTMAQAGFEVLITCDQNLPYQQNASLPVALIVLRVPDNRVPTVLALSEKVQATLQALLIGQIVQLE
jgi:hypothetical protein